MKNFLLKLGNIASWTVVGATGIYSFAALLYGVLPADATEPIVTALNTNVDAIVPVGIFLSKPQTYYYCLPGFWIHPEYWLWSRLGCF